MQWSAGFYQVPYHQLKSHQNHNDGAFATNEFPFPDNLVNQPEPELLAKESPLDASNPGPDSGILVKKKYDLVLQRDGLNYKPKIFEPARPHLLIQTAPVPVDFGEFSWFLHRKSRLDWTHQCKNLDWQPRPAWLGLFPLGRYLENQTGFPRDLPWKQSALEGLLGYKFLLACLIDQHSRVFQKLE